MTLIDYFGKKARVTNKDGISLYALKGKIPMKFNPMRSLFSIFMLLSLPAVMIADQKKEVASTIDVSGDLLKLEKANPKIAVIDEMTIMRTCEQGQKITQELESKRQELAVKAEGSEKKLQEEVKNYQAKAPAMKQEARDAEQQRLTKLGMDHESLLKSCEAEFKLAVNQATERIGREVEDVATKIAQQEGVDLLIDKSTGRVLYASDKADLTGKTIHALNAKAEQKTVVAKKTAEKPAAKAAA